MKHRGRIALALACLLMSSCATAPYVAPADGPKAELRLATVGGVFAAATLYDEAESCSGMRSPGELHKTRERSVAVAAGRPLSFSMESIGAALEQCRIVLTFTPLEGHRYSAIYLHEGGPSQCAIRLSDVTKNDPAPVNSRKRAFTPPALPSSPSCR